MDKSQVNKYKIGRGCVFNVNYHFVWCPKRRASVLNGRIVDDLQEIIKNVAAQNQFSVESSQIMPDHIHLFVSCHPKLSPHLIVKKIKGASSNILRKKYPQLLKIPCLWSGSYYCGTAGCVSESVIKNYIENQKNS